MFELNVFVTNASLNVNKLYSYYSLDYVDNFKRVEISFARNITTGIVISSSEFSNLKEKEKELGFKLIKIRKVIDEDPIISKRQYELAKWLSKTTVSPFISCLNTMLPKALRTSKKLKSPRTIEYIKKINKDALLTNKQKEIFALYKDGMSASEARKLSASIFNKLLSLGLIEIYKEEKKYVETSYINKNSFLKLTKDQEQAFNSLIKTDKQVSLLFGVTGSGKTEVYLHLAREYLKDNKQVLILVPEISLTPQMIKRVNERFDGVVFYHSELSDQERYEQYQRVKNDDINIVVGTRSSIFLPFNNLGLIIIDEEHDGSYKQDSSPCYSAINVAKKIANDTNSKVLLASATPSLDSYTRAIKGEYNLITLKSRINDMLPSVEIVDLTSEVKSKNSYIISSKLKNELDKTLSNHKQAIILLNRRGYSPIIKCADCMSTLMCKFCDTPLNYHKDLNAYKCHECGRTYKKVTNCPNCNSKNLIYYGFGTKKVEEELSKLYPSIRIDRMDKDNVTKKDSYKTILDKVGSGETDILIGTQMIAKGLDYPNVTLVGILNADAGLMRQDYNSAKVTFDLLMQASGRSGRSKDKGKVIIQAFNPEHFVLKSVIKQDYEYFYNIEMNYRNKLKYPPYSHIVEFIVSDMNEKKVDTSLKFINERLEKYSFKTYKVLKLSRINGFNRSRIIVLDRSLKSLIEASWKIIDEYLQNSKLSKIKVEFDPLYLE